MKSFVPEVPLYVGEVCCVTSLGLDMPTVAAAMRCGMSRPSELEGDETVAEDGSLTPTRCHAIPGLALGFVGQGRYRRLLGRLLDRLDERLRRRSGGSAAKDRPTYVLLGVPDFSRYGEGIAQDDGSPLHERRGPNGPEPGSIGEIDWERMLSELLERVGWSSGVRSTRVVRTGTSRTPRLFQMATRALVADEDAEVVLITLDSLVEPAAIEWLRVTGRLADARHPVGTCPGECACALIMRTEATDRHSVRIESTRFAHAESSVFSDVPDSGTALRSLMSAHASERPEGSWWMANLTGEHPLAREWAVAGTVRARSSPDSPDASPWVTARSLGDIGVAYLCTAIGWVQQAVARGYSETRRCGIVSMDHTTARSIVSVHVP